jgi:uncharacterized membrane protein
VDEQPSSGVELMNGATMKIDGFGNRLGELFRKYAAYFIWMFGSAILLFSSVSLDLWRTPRNKAFVLCLIGGMGFWVRLISPRLVRVVLSKRQANCLALLFVAGYSLASFLIARYSIAHFIRIKGDFGVFLQSLWWTQHGIPLFNTLDGTSHLGVHSSFILFAMVPLYYVWHSPLSLIAIQYASLGAAGFLFFRMARRHVDEVSSLILLLVFLLFPASQYNFGDFYESSLAAPFVVLVLDSVLVKRWTVLVIASGFLITVKETFPLMLILLGIYMIVSKVRVAGIATSVVGLISFYAAMSIIIPWFQARYAVFPTDFHHISPFASFGNTPLSIMSNAILHPATTISVILQTGKIPYLLSLAAPYLFVGFLGSAIWIVALPELAITLLSNHPDNSSVLLANSRFSTVIVVALGISAVITLRRIGQGLGSQRALALQTIASTFLFVTLGLAPLWLNSTLMAPVTGAGELPAVLAMVGPDAAVAVPYDVVAPFAQRAVVFDIDRNPPEVIASCSEYVVFRQGYSENRLHDLVKVKGFRQAWSGEVFELWQSDAFHQCIPARKPW